MPNVPTVQQKREVVLDLIARGRVVPELAAVLWYIAHNDDLLERIHFIDTLVFCTNVMIVGEQDTEIQYYMAFDLNLRQQVFQALVENKPIPPNIKDLLEAEVVQQSISLELAIGALRRHRGYIYAQFNYQNNEFPPSYLRVVLANPYVRQLSEAARRRSYEIFGASNTKNDSTNASNTSAEATKNKSTKQVAVRERQGETTSNQFTMSPVDYYILIAHMKQALDDALLRHETERARGLYDAIKIVENFMRQYSH